MSSPNNRINADGCFPLALAASASLVVFVSVSGGVGAARRIADMGIVPGTKIEVVSGGSQPGPVIIRVRGTKLVIGRGMARRIAVRPVRASEM